MASTEELQKKGLETRRQLAGGKESGGPPRPIYRYAPELGQQVEECLFGGVWGRPGLDIKYRSLATISALAALGGREPQLKGHIRTALLLGLTPVQVLEALIHLFFYAGLPASHNAINLAFDVFKERADWISQVEKPAHEAVSRSFEERQQRAQEVRSKLWGKGAILQMAAVQDLAGDFMSVISAYLFGEIYHRPGLDLTERCICSLAAVTALGRERQVKNFVLAALHLGMPVQEVTEVITHTTCYSGLPAALNALIAMKEVLDEQQLEVR